MTAEQASDIDERSWLDRALPPGLRPYGRLMRLDRAIGTWLLLLPGWWSLALAPREAGYRWPDLWLFALFGIGALVMRGAGCVVNDLWDRDFDARVARTASRPIPSGAVSVRQALLFLVLLLLIGLVILVQFNRLTIWLGVASLALVVTYPLMKRITWWPQAFLGLTFNWGALMGWTAVTGSLDLAPVILYAAGIAWTLAYDTIYAHQDKDDDALIGIRSTALRLGRSSPAWVAFFFALALAGIGIAGSAAGLHPLWWIAVAAAAGHAAWQVATWDMDAPRNCRTRFQSNRDFALIVLAGILLARLLGA